jgi:hypothetical protein
MAELVPETMDTSLYSPFNHCSASDEKYGSWLWLHNIEQIAEINVAWDCSIYIYESGN